MLLPKLVRLGRVGWRPECRPIHPAAFKILQSDGRESASQRANVHSDEY